MLILMVAALQAEVISFPPLPRVPPPPPPFTRKVEVTARRIGARVSAEFERCGYARTNSNGRYVEAMGTPAHSPEWQKAAAAMENALKVCRGLRRALRAQQNFLRGIAQNGTRHDAELASGQLKTVSYELQGLEQYYATEVPQYRQVLSVGWGDPHCVEHPDAFTPPIAACPKGSDAPP